MFIVGRSKEEEREMMKPIRYRDSLWASVTVKSKAVDERCLHSIL
jgi:hypothetical protein